MTKKNEKRKIYSNEKKDENKNEKNRKKCWIDFKLSLKFPSLMICFK